ncbi:hypothetical protein NQZ68_028750 [Dissostichus eleginoides]|nr:hypothetical protein NQZ68_028750 [Dissostichus eleginoides]
MQVFAQVGEEQHVRSDDQQHDRCCSCMSFTASTVKTPLYPGTPQAALQQHRGSRQSEDEQICFEALEPLYVAGTEVIAGRGQAETSSVAIIHRSVPHFPFYNSGDDNGMPDVKAR